MLVLTRKLGEEICIGNGILVRVLDVHGSRVKLGITCSRDVKVLRGELATHVSSGAKPSAESTVVSPQAIAAPDVDGDLHPPCYRTIA